MKNLLISPLVVLALALTFAFTSTNLDSEKSLAQVDQVQGVYIFVKSKPVREYEFLGTVGGPVIGQHQFDKLLNSMLKDLKKNYPEADGLIFDGLILETHNTKASAVKFKE